jgi:hypothetical protein
MRTSISAGRDFHQLTVDTYAAQHGPREAGSALPPGAHRGDDGVDVAAAGAMVGSVAGHAQAVRAWAAAIWQAWAAEHAMVAAVADRLLR